MINQVKCPICFTVNTKPVWEPGDGFVVVHCEKCGKFRMTDDAVGYWYDKYCHNPKTRAVANASSWLYYSCNQASMIQEDDLIRCESMRIPSFNERADLLLKYLEKKTEHIGQMVPFSRDEIFTATWSYDIDETQALLNYLSGEGRICVLETYDAAMIQHGGWSHIETLRGKNLLSQQGFVAMWFGDHVQSAYDQAISPAIEEAGYSPHRVDLGEHNQKIDDEIIVQIRRSRFVVADFTGHRGGVYYEAGFGHGLGLEVFFTCRNDDRENLHFDIRQYNCIFWENDKLDEFKLKLAKRIEAVLGKGNVSVAM